MQGRTEKCADPESGGIGSSSAGAQNARIATWQVNGWEGSRLTAYTSIDADTMLRPTGESA